MCVAFMQRSVATPHNAIDLGLNYLDSFRIFPEYIDYILQVWAISMGIFDVNGRYIYPCYVCMVFIYFNFQLIV